MHRDKFNLCWVTPLGNVVSDQEAKRIAELEDQTREAKENAKLPPDRTKHKRLFGELKKAVT